MKRKFINFSFVDAKVDRIILQYGLVTPFFGLKGLFDGVKRRDLACEALGVVLPETWGDGEYLIEKVRAIHWRKYGDM